MTERSVLVRLMANVTDFQAQMAKAEKAVGGVGRKTEDTAKQADTSLGRMARSAQDNRQAWDTAGTALTAFGAVTVGALALSAKAAIDWESQFAGVEKTVNGTAGELRALEGDLRAMARSLPATHGEIAAVAEAAGQLGVQTASIASFTRTMVDLGETTNLSADEAATSIAQMMNVMQTAPEDVDRMGATLVALGNAGASTERDIIQMSQRIAGAAAIVGMSEADVLAFSNAVASMGINVEAGGTSVSRVLTDMSKAAQTGGEDLAVFAETAGVSADEFSRSFSEDPAEAFASFIDGLGGIQQAGGNVFAVLDQLGLSDVRVSQALLGMASSGDLLRESLDLGAEAWQDNTALAVEAAKRYETTASQLQVAKNNATDAAIGFGEVLVPAVGAAAEAAKDLAGWLADLDEGQKTAVVSMAGVTGGAALLGGAFLLTFPRIVDTYQAFRDLRDISPGTASNLGKVGKAAGITAAALTALSIADDLFSELGNVQSTSQATASLVDMTLTIEDLDEQVRGLTESSRTLSNFGDADGFGSLEQGLSSIANPGMLDRLADVNREITSLGGSKGRAERDILVRQLEAQGEALATLAQSGNTELAAEQFAMFEDAAERAGMPLEDLLELMPAYRDALADLEVEEALGGVTRMSDEARAAVFGLSTEVRGVGVVAPQAAAQMEGFTSSMRLVGDTTGWTEEQLEAAEDRIKEWQETLGSAMASFSEPLSTYQGMLQAKTDAEQEQAEAQAEATESSEDSWEDYVSGVTVSLGEYAAQLEANNAAQEEWRDNLVRVAARGREGVAEQLAAMGPEGARLTADLADATDVEFNRMAAAMIEDARFGGEGAVDALDTEMRVMERVGRAGAKDTAESIAKELGLGVGEVERIAAQYSEGLAGGINPLLDSLGRPKVSLGRGRTGNIPNQAMADGGIEDHRAQIAPAGTWRTWAEDETGGEAYIPLSPAKRARSMAIWEETGRRLGVPVGGMADYAQGGITQAEAFANGGFSSGAAVPKPSSTNPYRAPISTAGDATMERAYQEALAFVEQNSVVGGLPPGTSLPPGTGASVAALVAYGRALRAQGLRVSSNAALGNPPRPGAHSPTGYHYRFGNSGAIDVNSAPGESLAEKRRLAPIALDMIRRGFAVQFDGPGHGDHLHADVGSYTRIGNLARYMGGGGNKAMAEGGILNPHVRDRGGPLLPGYTLNATGGPETVIPDRVFDSGPWAGPGSPGGVGTTVTIPVTVTADAPLAAHYAERVSTQITNRLEDAIAATGLAGIANGGPT